MQCFPCLVRNKAPERRPLIRRKTEERSASVYKFGPENEYAGEKSIINEFLYWIQYKGKRLAGGDNGKAFRAMSDIAEAMIQCSVLCCENGEGNNLEPLPYGLRNVYGPVIDFQTVRDQGHATVSPDRIWEEEKEEFRKNESVWLFSLEAEIRFHEIMERLVKRLSEMNRLRIMTVEGKRISFGLFEYADSMANFAVQFCKYSSSAKTIPVHFIHYDAWNPMKWDIKPAYFNDRMSQDHRTVVIIN